MVADVIVVMEVQAVVVLSGSSLFFAAVVATALADLVAMAVATMIAVVLSGFYLFFAAVVAMALADAVIPAANFLLVKLIGGVASQRRFLIFYSE